MLRENAPLSNSPWDHLDAERLIPDSLKRDHIDVRVIRKELRGKLRLAIVDSSGASRPLTNGRSFELTDDEDKKLFGIERLEDMLLMCVLSRITPEMLFYDILTVNPYLTGQGVGSSFNKNVVNEARSLDARFLTGMHASNEATRFFLKQGGFLTGEVRQTHRGEFEPLITQTSTGEGFYSVQFLNPEDTPRYVKAKPRKMQVETRIKHEQERLARLWY